MDSAHKMDMHIRGLYPYAYRKYPQKWSKITNLGPTEIWTRVAGFKVQNANHYTMGPRHRDFWVRYNYVSHQGW